jgi:hypothetical protein
VYASLCLLQLVDCCILYRVRAADTLLLVGSKIVKRRQCTFGMLWLSMLFQLSACVNERYILSCPVLYLLLSLRWILLSWLKSLVDCFACWTL